jgi:Tol biopolymer transport system component
MYLSYRAGTPHIWRSRLDGSDARQMTNGAGEFMPSCSPDGTWFTYSTSDPKAAGVWRMPIDGGNAVRIWERYGSTVISPDGKLIAIGELNGPQANAAVVIPAEGGRPVRTFNINPEQGIPVEWTPDGNGLLWIKIINGVFNVWRTNLDFDEAIQLTRFDNGMIDSAHMSHDGKNLAVMRFSTTSNVALIKDLDAK